MTEVIKKGINMSHIVKKRIEQIRQGIVPQGYKETKMGIIPEEWGIKRFKDVVEKSSERYNPNEENKNYKCIELEHIDSGTGELNGYIDSDSTKSTKAVFYKNDTLYGGLRPYLKKYYYAKFKGVCSTEIWVLRPLNSIIDANYLFYLVQTDYFNYKANVSTGSSMPRADWNYVSDVWHLIPSIVEQQQIAEILSTWDRAIELKESLIKEKKEQKKGLMQKLLKPKVSWEEMRLGDLSTIVTGTTPPTSVNEYYDGEYPWVTPTDIKSDKYLYTSERTLTEKGMEKGRFVPKDSLLITCIASIGKNAILKKDGSCNQQINAIYPSETHSNEFLYYLITHNTNKLFSHAATTATSIINKHTFENIRFLLPSLNEQNRIANFLSAADKEINLLKQELELLKEQKKGLMQLLLTGIVRVGEVE